MTDAATTSARPFVASAAVQRVAAASLRTPRPAHPILSTTKPEESS
ncbi:MAG: hypothetical protein M3Y06_07690 [Actinomycetota bacterium]|nr:hypothetical protein [Actinomycetota bacterium]